MQEHNLKEEAGLLSDDTAAKEGEEDGGDDDYPRYHLEVDGVAMD